MTARDDELDPNLDWDPMMVGKPKGTHLGAQGASPLVYSDATNTLSTHARLAPMPESDDDLADLIARIAIAGAGLVVGIGIGYAAPKVRAWWRGVRAAKGTPALAAGQPVDEAEVGEVQVPIEAQMRALGAEVEHAVAEQRAHMTNEEAQRHIVALLIALAVAAQEWRALRGATTGDDTPQVVKDMVAQVCAVDVLESLDRMLAADRGWLDPEDSARLLQFYGGGGEVAGAYQPLRVERVREALRLAAPLEEEYEVNADEAGGEDRQDP
nr:hypothetical protein [Propionibacterium sp.]